MTAPLTKELAEPILKMWNRIFTEDEISGVFATRKVITLLSIAIEKQGLLEEYGQLIIDATASTNQAILKLGSQTTHVVAFQICSDVVANIALIIYDPRMGIISEANMNKGRVINV